MAIADNKVSKRTGSRHGDMPADGHSSQSQANGVFHGSGENGSMLGQLMSVLLRETNETGARITLTQQWVEFTGQTHDEVEDFGWLSSIHHDDLRAIEQCLRHAFANGQSETELRIRSAQGDYRWFQVQFSLVPVNHGSTHQQWFGAALDIHEKKIAQEELEKNEEKYRTIFETIDEGFCIFELIYENEKPVDLRWVEVNPAYEKQTGLVNTIGQLASEVMPGTESHWFEIYDEVAKTGNPVHFENIHEPTDRWYYVFASRMGGAGSGKVAVVFSDITERKHREQVQEYLLKLSDALRSVGDPIKIQETAAELLGESLRATRSFYYEVECVFDSYVHKINKDFCRNSTQSMVGTYPRKLPAKGQKDLFENLYKGETLVVDDVDKIDWLPAEELNGFHALEIKSFISVPFLRDGKYIAGINVQSSVARKWTKTEIEITVETAERTWAAVERAKAEEALHDTQKRLERELTDVQQLQQISSRLIEEDNVQTLYNHVLDAAMALMHSDFGSMQLFIPEKQQLQLLAWKNFHPLSAEYWQTITMESITTCGSALRTLDRQIVPDVDKDEAIAGGKDIYHFHLSGIVAVQSTPLISRSGKLMGMISTHWKEVYEPTEREFNLFDVIARQAADLIERKWAEDVIQSTLRDTQLLRDLGERLIPEADGERLYNEILEAAITLTNADGGTVQLYDNTSAELHLVATKGFEKDMTDYFYAVDASSNTSCGIALATNKRVFINFDVPAANDPDGSMQMHVDAGYLCAQSTPLLSRLERPIGMITTHWNKHSLPSEHQLRFIDILARQAADLIERKQVEEALRESEERLQMAVESGNIGTCDWNYLTNEMNWNDVRFRLYGIRQQEAKINIDAFYELIHADDLQRVKKEITSGIEQRGAFAGEYRIVQHDGSCRWIFEMGRVVERKDGKPYRIVSVSFDITARKQLDQQKEDFIGTASHELKTPVTSMKGYAQIVQAGLKANGDQQNAVLVTKLNGQIERLVTLIDHLLDTTRISEGKLKLNLDEVDIDSVVKESTEEMASTTGHVFEVNVHSGQLIRADRERVDQVMINLLSNAIKYSLPNTVIKVESRVVDGFVEVSVTDHGYGIPEDDQEKVFDRFYRVTKNKMDTFPGMGLGLYISSQIVQRHGGRISVKSKPGDGSRFSFYLPIKAAL